MRVERVARGTAWQTSIVMINLFNLFTYTWILMDFVLISFTVARCTKNFKK